jgi:hypothetical protein
MKSRERKRGKCEKKKEEKGKKRGKLSLKRSNICQREENKGKKSA